MHSIYRYVCVRGIFIKMELTYCYLFQSILRKKLSFFSYLFKSFVCPGWCQSGAFSHAKAHKVTQNC